MNNKRFLVKVLMISLETGECWEDVFNVLHWHNAIGQIWSKTLEKDPYYRDHKQSQFEFRVLEIREVNSL